MPKIGIGLPADDSATLRDWARRADAGPFRTLALLDRLVYDNPEPLVALAGVAGATSRIRVQTEVLLAPLRDPVLLAKQCATLDRLSGGRFTLGLGLGGREDDYRAAGVDIRARGRRLDEQLALMRRLWAGEPYGEGIGPVGPAPARAGGPEILFGAFAPAATERVARWGDGFVGAAPPEHLGRLFDQVRRQWVAAGRSGAPRLVAQANVAVGPAAVVDAARAAIGAYYAFLGDPGGVVGGMLTTAADIRRTVAEFDALGADEVILYCWSPDADQVDRLADTVV
jgi:alkanesulfonate monooxygenase SsuD/methylene tetrahydromethanopterin reductase-like flavin-dependent oxidoreductase (luciferase family)